MITEKKINWLKRYLELEKQYNQVEHKYLVLKEKYEQLEPLKKLIETQKLN